MTIKLTATINSNCPFPNRIDGIAHEAVAYYLDPFLDGSDSDIHLTTTSLRSWYYMRKDICDWLRDGGFSYDIRYIELDGKSKEWKYGYTFKRMKVWIHFEDPDAAFAFKLRWYNAAD